MSTSANRRRWYSLLAMFLGVSPFVLFEVGLQYTGLGAPQGYSDPFVGFSEIHPLFELDAGAGRYETAASRLPFFGHQQFIQKKPTDGFRAFCLGGSTVLGHPYQPDTAFSEWMEIELAQRGPWSTCEVVNCGGISYASYRLVPILREALGYEPDLIVVASGHNEFLEDRTYESLKSRSAVQRWVSDRLYALHTVNLAIQVKNAVLDSKPARTILPAEVDARLDHASGFASYHRDEAWHEGVLAHYRENLRTMARLCREAGVPLVLVNLGSNIRDCPPFKSQYKDGLDQAELDQWQRWFDEAAGLEKTDPQAAMRLYQQCQAIDDQYALLWYRLGRCLDRLGNYPEALKCYVRSKDLDVCPLRMLEQAHAIVFEVAAEESVPVVDARSMLEAHSEHGLAGSNLYLDHVHPDVFGHQRIAEALVQETARLLGVSLKPWKDFDRRKAYHEQLARLGTLYLAQGRLRVEWLEDWARRDLLRSDVVPWDVRGEIEVGNRWQDFGNADLAFAAYRKAAEQSERSFDLLLVRAHSLFQQGRFDEAAGVAGLVAELSGGHVQDVANAALAVIRREQGKPAASIPTPKKGCSPWYELWRSQESGAGE